MDIINYPAIRHFNILEIDLAVQKMIIPSIYTKKQQNLARVKKSKHVKTDIPVTSAKNCYLKILSYQDDKNQSIHKNAQTYKISV